MTLESKFDDAMHGIHRAAGELNPPYLAHGFLGMLRRNGGKETAERLLAKDRPSDGFTELFLRGPQNLKISVEYLVLCSPWRQLFTDDQLTIARQRLREVECPLPPEDSETPSVERWHVEPDSDSEHNIPDCITRIDILESMQEFELLDGFGQSTFYDVLDDYGVRYPPKALIGLAALKYTDVPLRGKNFQGGPGTKCFRMLEQHDFKIVPKASDGNRDYNEIQIDVKAIKRNPNVNEPTKRRLIEARTGQGQFRKDVLSIEKRCRVTGVSNPDLLIAGHIVPFSKCLTNEEKYDPNNGLLFTPNADRLFERGLMSFEDDGTMILTKELADKDRMALGIPASLDAGEFNKQQLQYLRRHRELHSL